MTSGASKCCLYVCLLILIFFESVECSDGDRSSYYQRCVQNCKVENCTKDGVYFKLSQKRSLTIHYLWTCKDDCQYECMWGTVNAYMKRSWNIPQFHGKWPFIRFMGMQEPASVFCSILNLVAHYIMLRRFCREVPKACPLYMLWHIYGFVCLNGWFWSAVFHSRDTPLTEKMDYFCAFSMVLYSFYAMFVRFLNRRLFFISLLTLFCLVLFVHHVSYLSLVIFDYGYNMRVNIFIGAVCTISSLVWCGIVRRQQPYVWRCAAYFILTGLSALLEMSDFPPLFWVVDAHALFHLSTAFLPFLYYRFLIDDCHYLLEKEKKEV